MDDSELYSRLLEKSSLIESAYGDRVVEYPSDRNGMYFNIEGKTVRPLRHIYVWTPSFFIASSILKYKDRGDRKSLLWAEHYYGEYLEKVTRYKADTMHDLGFTYTLYSVLLYRITGKRKYAELSCLAADVLLERFVSPYIRAWGRMDDIVPSYVEEQIREDKFFTESKGLSIIDTMMNLPLLLFAWEYTGDDKYLDAAVSHADATMKNFIRSDMSVMHAYNYDRMKEDNDCGYSIGSYWARGAAWAIYGFAVIGRYTGDRRYKAAAEKLLSEYLRHTSSIPVWDFRLPEDVPQSLDTSAAVIVASACHLIGTDEARSYASCVLKEIRRYVNFNPDVPGMLSEQNGRHEYTVFGDYFLLELLSRKEDGAFIFW